MNDSLRRALVFILSASSIVLLVGSFSDGAFAQNGETPQAQESSASSEEPSAGSEDDVDDRKTDSEAQRKPPRSRRVLIPKDVVEHLPPVLKVRVLGTQIWKILALVVIFLVGLLLRKILQVIVVHRLAPIAARLGRNSVNNIVAVVAGPGSILVVSGLLALYYPQLELDPFLEQIVRTAVRCMAILSIVLSAYRMVDVLADRMSKNAESTDSRLDDQLVPLVRKALKVLVLLSGALFLLQNLDVNVGSLIAGLGIGGVAVALAAKDTIANFFGSLMIFIDRPFQIGDWVKIGDVEGIVEAVGFRSTRVRTFYNSLVTVPNAHFTESTIDNIGLREFRRIKTTLRLTYDTTPEQVQALVEGIRAIICANKFTRKDYYEIHFSDFGEHSLEVLVYLFVKVRTWSDELEQRHNILLEILRLAKELQVNFAFPTQTLHVDTLAAPGVPNRQGEAPKNDQLSNVVQSFGPGGTLSRPYSPRLTEGYLAGTVKSLGGDD